MPEDLPPIPPSYIDTTGGQEDYYRSEALRATKEIITDDLVEEKLKNFPLWSVMSKSSKLTFLTDNDVLVLDQLFEASVNQFMRSVPPCLHKAQLYTTLAQGRIINFYNIRRSKGFNSRGIMNERIAQLTQQKQIITSSENTGQKQGFFKRLFGGK